MPIIGLDYHPGFQQIAFVDCCWKIAFRRSGYRVGRIEICGNCCGTGTGWCRRARGS